MVNLIVLFAQCSVSVNTQTLHTPFIMSLAGKIAVVAGSTRGIGRGIALHLAKAGASLALLYNSDATKANEVRCEHSGTQNQATSR